MFSKASAVRPEELGSGLEKVQGHLGSTVGVLGLGNTIDGHVRITLTEHHGMEKIKTIGVTLNPRPDTNVAAEYI